MVLKHQHDTKEQIELTLSSEIKVIRKCDWKFNLQLPLMKKYTEPRNSPSRVLFDMENIPKEALTW